MQRKYIKYGIWLVVFFFVFYNSVYFKKLSEVKEANKTEEFDAAAYAKEFWNNEILPAAAGSIKFTDLINQLKQNPVDAFRDYSHALGIGNIRFFLVKDEATVISINENDVTLMVDNGDSKNHIVLATEFIYGNAVRDAVGEINLNEFTNTMHLNKVSAEINRIIRNKIVPPFKENAKKGDRIKFSGAIELNQKFLDLESIELIPVSLEIIKQ